MNKSILSDLEKKAAELRLALLRTFGTGKAHHFGGSLSSMDLVCALYFYKMNYSKETVQDPKRDRLILSKGHSVPAQYVALAELGIHAKSELKEIKKLGSVFQGHPDMHKTLGIEAPTGSLGQGLSFANGIALAQRADGIESMIYVILGDGELQEGQVWEALMTTAHYNLGNVCAIVDRNGYQSQGSIDDLMGIEPLEHKFSSFGWDVKRIDGHNMEAICAALDSADKDSQKPTMIIADTIKAKGIAFMEGSYTYHNYSLDEQLFDQAEKELLTALAKLS